MSSREWILSITVLSFFVIQSVKAEDATIAGNISTPYPTIHHLAVEWHIQL